MGRTRLLAASLVLPFAVAPSVRGSEEGTPVQIGVRRMVESKILGESRPILVHLPDGYEKESARHPVLYRLDGEGFLFLDAVAAERSLAGFAERIPAHIVIGIVNTDRGRDLSMVHGGERFLRFIVEELIPFVDEGYRTTPERTLCGQSASANFAAQILVRKPMLFAGYILGSLGPGAGELDGLLQRLSSEWPAQPGMAVFVTLGRQDSYDPTGERSRNAEAFVAALRRAGGPRVRGEVRVYEDEGHVPGPGVYDGLKWMHTR